MHYASTIGHSDHGKSTLTAAINPLMWGEMHEWTEWPKSDWQPVRPNHISPELWRRKMQAYLKK